jgi:hypothetical protein
LAAAALKAEKHKNRRVRPEANCCQDLTAIPATGSMRLILGELEGAEKLRENAVTL